ncbi:MAG: hypothetical protein R2755_11000 [Acidimicrobiales bacterium]
MKIGVSGVKQLLRAGVNDLGGTLIDENISALRAPPTVS